MRPIEELYHLHKQDVYRYLLSLTRDPSLSEDLLSETFISAIRGIDGFKGRSSLKTWLYSIARRKWMDELRKKRSTVSYSELLDEYAGGSLEQAVMTEELRRRIEALIDSKEERIRKVVLMRIEGYSYEEIAETLHLSGSSARVIEFRFKQWLKQKLQEEGLL